MPERKAGVALTAEQRALVEAEWGTAERVAAAFGRKVPSLAEDFLGAVGLAACGAARTFDPGAGASFRTHLYNRCVGGCLDLMRANGPSGFRRDPEVAPAVTSMDWRPWGGDGEDGASGGAGETYGLLRYLAAGGPEPGHDEEAADEVRGLARGLPRQHREAVVRLYLHAGTATMKAAAAALGVCDSRVSQVHAEALALLRERLGARREAV